MITTIKSKTTNGAHLSASQLRTFSQCSLQWLLSRYHKPEFVGSGLRFGGASHRALQAFYQGRLEGREVSSEAMLAAFDSAWAEEEKEAPNVPVQFGKNETKDGLRATAARMFECFVGSVQPGKVVAVEERFECHLGDGMPPLVGYVDLVEIRKNAKGTEELAVVDFKTAARRPAEGIMDEDQLVIYGLGLARIGLLKQFDLPLSLRYDVLLKTKTAELLSIPVRPTRRDAERLIAKASCIWKAMSAEAVWPTSGWWCQGCGYSERCHQWPNLPQVA
jgi:hypothetical protein